MATTQKNVSVIEAATEDEAGNIIECYCEFNKEEMIIKLEILGIDIKLELSKKWRNLNRNLALQCSVPEQYCSII